MICKNPGGGYTPPNFTQGGVMDCHPPPLKPPMYGSQKCILYILTYILKVFYSTICENWFSILTKNTPLNSTKINERFNLFTKGEYLIWNHNGLSIDKSRVVKTSHNLIWSKILNFLEHSGFISGSAWVGRILALICAAFEIGKLIYIIFARL